MSDLQSKAERLLANRPTLHHSPWTREAESVLADLLAALVQAEQEKAELEARLVAPSFKGDRI